MVAQSNGYILRKMLLIFEIFVVVQLLSRTSTTECNSTAYEKYFKSILDEPVCPNAESEKSTLPYICGKKYSDNKGFMHEVEEILMRQCDLTDMFRGHEDYQGVRHEQEVDFIIVGAGTAGSIVAGRLAEAPEKWEVVVLEAGGPYPTAAMVPGTYLCYTKPTSPINWNFEIEDQENACLGQKEGKCTYVRGKALGGSAVLNDMLYIRGNSYDYDNWAAAGNEGWSYEEVLHYFKMAENNDQIGDKYFEEDHGDTGPVPVSEFKYKPELIEKFLKAAEDMGYVVNHDLNGENQLGFSIAQGTTFNGSRITTYTGYIESLIGSIPNLLVSPYSYVTRILIDDNKNAIGVEYKKHNNNYRLFARKEVIISAGPIQSPHLLLNSGIGPKEDLEEIGVTVVKDLHQVGEDLNSHVSFSVRFLLKDKCLDDPLNKLTLLQFIHKREGPLSCPGLHQFIGFIHIGDKTGIPKYVPNVQISTEGLLADCSESGDINYGIRCDKQRHVYITASLLHPKSKGYITLRNIDPMDSPVIYNDFLENIQDRQTLIAAIKFIIKLAETAPLKDVIELDTEPVKNCESQFGTDKYWECAIRHWAKPDSLQTGSCSMGEDEENSVVDSQLQVHGIDGLRVVDSSIIPVSISGSSNAPEMMVAEKGAEMVKAKWSENSDAGNRKKHGKNFHIKHNEGIGHYSSEGDYRDKHVSSAEHNTSEEKKASGERDTTYGKKSSRKHGIINGKKLYTEHDTTNIKLSSTEHESVSSDRKSEEHNTPNKDISSTDNTYSGTSVIQQGTSKSKASTAVSNPTNSGISSTGQVTIAREISSTEQDDVSLSKLDTTSSQNISSKYYTPTLYTIKASPAVSNITNRGVSSTGQVTVVREISSMKQDDISMSKLDNTISQNISSKYYTPTLHTIEKETINEKVPSTVVEATTPLTTNKEISSTMRIATVVTAISSGTSSTGYGINSIEDDTADTEILSTEDEAKNDKKAKTDWVTTSRNISSTTNGKIISIENEGTNYITEEVTTTGEISHSVSDAATSKPLSTHMEHDTTNKLSPIIGTTGSKISSNEHDTLKKSSRENSDTIDKKISSTVQETAIAENAFIKQSTTGGKLISTEPLTTANKTSSNDYDIYDIAFAKIFFTEHEPFLENISLTEYNYTTFSEISSTEYYQNDTVVEEIFFNKENYTKEGEHNMTDDKISSIKHNTTHDKASYTKHFTHNEKLPVWNYTIFDKSLPIEFITANSKLNSNNIKATTSDKMHNTSNGGRQNTKGRKCLHKRRSNITSNQTEDQNHTIYNPTGSRELDTYNENGGHAEKENGHLEEEYHKENSDHLHGYEDIYEIDYADAFEHR